MQEVKATEALEFATAEGVILWGGRKAGRKAPLRKPLRAVVEIAAKGVVTITFPGTERGVEVLRTGTVFYAAPVEQSAPTAEEVKETAKDRAAKARDEAEAQHEKGERKARKARSKKAAAADDDTLTAQDIADAELGACEWMPEELPANAQEVAQEATQSVADAAADRAEREALEKARARAERLRNRDAFEVRVEEVPVPANFLELAKEGNTTAAKRYWSRRVENYTLVETIKAHARANYENGGWDVVVETYDDAEILAFCQEKEVTTAAEAIEELSLYAAAWAESECGALVDGWGV